MGRLAPLLLALCLPATAWSSELPGTVTENLPRDWSEPVPPPQAPADWVQALGGDALSALLGGLDGTLDVASAQSAVDQASGRSIQAASGWLPTLSTSASWSTGTPNAAFAAVAGNSQDQYSASADLSLPLTPWSSVPTQRAADADRRAAQADLDDARATALLGVVSAWLDVLQAHASLDIVQSQLDLESELLTLTEARYGVGELAGVDVLQQRQQLATTRSDLPPAEADVGRAERALAALLRVPTDHLPPVGSELPEPLVPAIPAPRELIPEDPTVASALESWKAARFRTRSARADFAPTLSASAGTGFRYTQAVDDSVTPTWSAGLQLQVPLFDGGSSVGVLKERSAAERQALVTLEQQVTDTVRDVEDALATYAQASRVREDAALAEQLAEDALEAARAGFAQGTTPYDTVLNTVKTTRTARLSALQAQRAHLDAALDLLAAVRFRWARTQELG